MDINILLEAFYDLIDFLGLIDDRLIDWLSLILIDLLWNPQFIDQLLQIWLAFVS